MSSPSSTGGAFAATPVDLGGAGAAKEARGGYRVWPVDPASFTMSRMQAVRHNFDQHPLMQLGELARLAKRLFPHKQCRFILPGATYTSEFDHQDTDVAGRSIDEVFERIEEPRSWIALYNVETDPLYKGFLAEVAASVRPLVEREQPGMYQVGGFIFISAPPSVTPFHIDRENNFWLQVRGRKVMSVFDQTDRDLVSAEAREKFIIYGENTRVKSEAFLGRAREFPVGPGDGVYFPSTSPHMTRCDSGWERPGDGVSISIGVVFYTEVTRRHAYVHAFNEFLRHRGMTPREPGESHGLDRIKALGGRALIWVAREFKGFKPTVSF